MDFFQRADSYLGKLYSRVCAVVLVLLGLFGLSMGIAVIFGETPEVSGFVPLAAGLAFFAFGVYLWRRPRRLSDMLS